MLNRKFAWLGVGAFLCLAGFSAPAQTRVLPFGDSVTSSFAPYSSYRYWLWQRLVDAGYRVDFVGTRSGVDSGWPERTDYDQDHEGHAGWTTYDALYATLDVAYATRPDIVLVDFGANDIDDGYTPDTIRDNLREIITRFRTVNPNVVIVLAQPTPYEGADNKQLARLRSAISRAARLENQRFSPVRVVNLGSGFSVRKDTFDGTHPNESGEIKIAKKYYGVIRRYMR
jgi:acyl-CoA thioesterase I